MTLEAPIPVPAGAPWLDGWRRAFAVHRGAALAQAATVSSTGLPEVRTVVVRGLSTDGSPYFATDVRSSKVQAVRSGSEIELCLWFPEPAVQFRLRGPAAAIGAKAGSWAPVRRDLWRALREPDRRAFGGPAPGTVLDGSDATPAATEAPHPNFSILIVTPLRFERLELGDPHVRHVWLWEDGRSWSSGRRVAP